MALDYSFINDSEPEEESSLLDYSFLSDEKPEEQPEKKPFVNDRTVVESVVDRVGDTAIDLAKGTIGLGQSVVGLGSLATGGLLSDGMRSLGYEPEEASKFLSDMYSDARKDEEQNIKDAKGFYDTAKAIVTQPGALVGKVAETAPMMLGSIALARSFAAKAYASAYSASIASGASATVATKVALEASVKAGTIAASTAEGAQQAGNSFDGYMAEGIEIGRAYVASIGSGITTGLQSFFGGKLGQKIGLGDIEAGVSARGGIVGRSVKGGAQEGLLEEMPQSAYEQAWDNYANERPLMQDVDKAAGTGLVVGSAAGGAFSALRKPNTENQEEPEQNDQTEQPVELFTPTHRAGGGQDVQTVTRRGNIVPDTYINQAGEVFRDSNAVEVVAPDLEMDANVQAERIRAEVFGDTDINIDTSQVEEIDILPVAYPESEDVVGEEIDILPTTYPDLEGVISEEIDILPMPEVQGGRGIVGGQIEGPNVLPGTSMEPEALDVKPGGMVMGEINIEDLPFQEFPGTQSTPESEVENVEQSGLIRSQMPSEAVEQDQSILNWDTTNRSRRTDEWFEGGMANTDTIEGFNDAAENGGNELESHGMGKEATLTGAVENLLNLITNGTDPTRGRNSYGFLDTAPLTSSENVGAGLGTASGTSYRTGPLIMVARPGERIGGDMSGVGAVLVNNAHPEAVTSIRDSIHKIRPDILVETYSEAGSVSKQLTSSAETAPVTAEAITATSEAITQASNEAATSPANSLPEPTEKQKEAGNYKKATIDASIVPWLSGMDIAIENPAGSKRKPEWDALKNDYGYFKGSDAFDGDEVDVFIGPDMATKPENIFVIDQVDPETGKPDEHKIILGVDNAEDAKKIYLDNYEKGWNGLGDIVEYQFDDFKTKLKDGYFKNSTPGRKLFNKKPAAKTKTEETFGPKAGQEAEPVKAPPGTGSERANKQSEFAKKKTKERLAPDPDSDDLITYIRKLGGINTDVESDVRGRLSQLNDNNRTIGLPSIEQKNGKGLTLDVLGESLIEAGYLKADPNIGNGVDKDALLELLFDAESGPVYSITGQEVAAKQEAEDLYQQMLEEEIESDSIDFGFDASDLNDLPLETTPVNPEISGLIEQADNINPGATFDIITQDITDAETILQLKQLIENPNETEQANESTSASAEATANVSQTESQVDDSQNPEESPDFDLSDQVSLAQQISDAKRTKDDKRNETSQGEPSLSQSGSDLFSNGGELEADLFSEPESKPEAVKKTPEDEKPVYEDPIMGPIDATIDKISDGGLKVDEFQSSYKMLIDNEQSIKEGLSKLTKPQLIAKYNVGRYEQDKKARVVDAAYDDLKNDFLRPTATDTGFIITSYSFDKVERQQKELDRIMAITQEMIDGYAEKVAKSKVDYKAKLDESSKGMKNPETIQDYKNILNKLGTDAGVKTFSEARSLMPLDQRLKFDNLVAKESRSKRVFTKDEQRTRVNSGSQMVEGEIIETTHTKKGHDLFVVQLAERVDKEDFLTLKNSSKKIGGYYSSYRGNGATPGFTFTEKEQAEAFIKLAAGDTSQATEVAQDRVDSFKDDRSQSSVERLRDMAGKLDDRGNTALNADRKTNTSKRAGQAASAIDKAEGEIAMAETMNNIANGIENGDIQFLDQVRTKTQIDMLDTFVHVGKSSEAIAIHDGDYKKQENMRQQPATSETVEYIEFPTYRVWRSDLARLGRELQQLSGTKLLGNRLLKIADDSSKQYEMFAKENINKVSVFYKKDATDAVFKTKKEADITIQTSGFGGQAISLKVKNGKHQVVMSPSEAQRRGVWTGGTDTRVSINQDFAQEIIAKVNRKQIRVPWQLENSNDKRKRLRSMNIETAAEFRSALQEYVGLRKQQNAPDKIKEMERSMVGRQKDGLDFFPTPAFIADEMIEAADIQEGMTVLEPSAGMGHIAEQIRSSGVEPDVIEMSNKRVELLEAKGFNVVGRDFMEFTGTGTSVPSNMDEMKSLVTDINKSTTKLDKLNARQSDRIKNEGRSRPRSTTYSAQSSTEAEFRDKKKKELSKLIRAAIENGGNVPDNILDVAGPGWEYVDGKYSPLPEQFGKGKLYDRIIMNPPFSDRRDSQHIKHAYDLLKPGGRLVSIAGEGVFFGNDKKAKAFRDWVDSVGGTDEKLDEGTFNDPSLPVSTGVNTRMLVIDKGETMFRMEDADPYLSMRGKDISYEVEVEETGEIYTVTSDAAETMTDIDNRISVLEQLRDCI